MEKLEEQGKVQILQNGMSENQQGNMTDWDIIILRDLRNQQSSIEDGVNKLGVVLEELVQMLDVDGRGIDVYLLQYAADARRCMREIIQILDSEKSLEPMHKS